MGIWEYATTLELPDELYRQARARTALDGRKMKDLVAEGLVLVLAGDSRRPMPTGAVREPPSRYGAAASYAARHRPDPDMKAVRASIARGLRQERGV